jgi:pyridoxal phosphate enzyme (YggS family)
VAAERYGHSGHSQDPSAQTLEDLAGNLAAVRARIAAAAERVGRRPEKVRLLPVSKTVVEQRIRLAVQAGCCELGENKVQEARRKHHNLADLDIAWSIIGHLQSNKARDLAAFAAEFQALDRLRVAELLDRRLQATGRGLDVYVQVNTSGEDSKYGVPPEETLGFLRELARFSALRVQGLMTLAVFTDDTDRIRSCFARLRQLRDEARQHDPDLIDPGGLSMGMSGDYETAVEEGATVVRVGQAIFGPRPLPDSYYWPGADS